MKKIKNKVLAFLSIKVIKLVYLATLLLCYSVTTCYAQGDNKEKRKDERKEKKEVRKEDKNHGRHVDNKLKRREEKHRVKSTE